MPFAQGLPQNCLHTIVYLLDPDQSPSMVSLNPEIAELCAQVLYTLCWYPQTSHHIMAFLRSLEFFSRHIINIGQLNNSPYLSLEQIAAQHHYTAWILKMIALELYIPSRGIRNSEAPLVSCILNLNGEYYDDGYDRQRRQLLQVIEPISLVSPQLDVPQLYILDGTLVNTAFKKCTKPKLGREGVQYCRIDNMLDFIRAEVGDVFDRANFEQELLEVARVANESNINSEIQASKAHLLRAWHRIVAVSLINYPHQTSVGDRKRQLSMILTELLNRFPENPDQQQRVDPELLTIVSDILVTLMTVLLQTILVQQTETQACLSQSESRRILDGIVYGILFRGSTTRTRINQYGALLLYLQISRATGDEEFPRRMRTPQRPFLEKVIQDASDAGGFLSVLATSALKEMFSVCKQHSSNWLAFFGQFSHLNSFVVRLLDYDDALRKAVSSTDERFLLIIQEHLARIGLLLEVARSPGGHMLIMKADLLQVLLDVHFIRERPMAEDVHTTRAVNTMYIPNIHPLYHRHLVLLGRY